MQFSEAFIKGSSATPSTVPTPPNHGLEAPAGPYRIYGPYRSLPIPVMEVTICLRAAAGSRRSM
ncbi:MAG: hypothetical protein K2F93_09445, partial [Muribaculaceae bacterium]|nr:hypothetical protein [Muribaculaceae bacterium]